jgi:hypothetical protein
MHRPAIDRLDEQRRVRQAMPARKRIDPGERQRRNGKIDMRDPKIIGHIDSGEKQCIASLDCIGSSWIANPLVSLQQAFDMKRERLPGSCNHMVDRQRRYRAGGKIRKRRRVPGIAVSFYNRDKDRHLSSKYKQVAVLHHFAEPGRDIHGRLDFDRYDPPR